MITRKFINKIRHMFNELRIKAHEGISFDDFKEKIFKLLSECPTIVDAAKIFKYYRFCIQKWDKIERIFKEKLLIWQEYTFNNPTSIYYDEECKNVETYYISNALTKSYNVFSIKPDENYGFCSFVSRGNKYFLNDFNDLYIECSNWNANKIKLLNKNDKQICIITSNELGNIVLESNQTEYEVISYTETTDFGEYYYNLIFRKSYIDSLGEDDEIDENKMIGSIHWDLLDKKNYKLGVAYLELVENIEDVNTLLYFTVSALLLHRRKTEAKLSAIIMMMNT